MLTRTSATLFALFLTVIQAFAADPTIEPWVRELTLATSDEKRVDTSASTVGGGILLKRTGKILWGSKVDGAEGILVLHPLNQTKPATAKLKLPSIPPKNKVFLFKGRGSDTEPGVIVKITAKGQEIKQIQIHRKWETLEIPLTQLPSGTTEIVIEIHPVGWLNEFAYIDFMGLVEKASN